MNSRSVPLFEKISGIKKIIKCADCGKRIEISNFNRKKCADCEKRW